MINRERMQTFTRPSLSRRKSRFGESGAPRYALNFPSDIDQFRKLGVRMTQRVGDGCDGGGQALLVDSASRIAVQLSRLTGEVRMVPVSNNA